jgi:hypothetical protein
MGQPIVKKLQFIKKDLNIPVKKGKMPKKSAKEIINPDNKRIKIFCINIRPGRPEFPAAQPTASGRPINYTIFDHCKKFLVASRTWYNRRKKIKKNLFVPV